MSLATSQARQPVLRVAYVHDDILGQRSSGGTVREFSRRMGERQVIASTHVKGVWLRTGIILALAALIACPMLLK